MRGKLFILQKTYRAGQREQLPHGSVVTVGGLFRSVLEESVVYVGGLLRGVLENQ